MPHLAVAAQERLADGDRISPGRRAAVAARAGVSQNTVDRFLKGETTPRGEDLDTMVTAVADVAGISWLDPWSDAIERAEVEADRLARDLGPTEDGGELTFEEVETDQARAERDVADSDRGGRPRPE